MHNVILKFQNHVERKQPIIESVGEVYRFGPMLYLERVGLSKQTKFDIVHIYFLWHRVSKMRLISRCCRQLFIPKYVLNVLNTRSASCTGT